MSGQHVSFVRMGLPTFWLTEPWSDCVCRPPAGAYGPPGDVAGNASLPHSLVPGGAAGSYPELLALQAGRLPTGVGAAGPTNPNQLSHQLMQVSFSPSTSYHDCGTPQTVGARSACPPLLFSSCSTSHQGLGNAKALFQLLALNVTSCPAHNCDSVTVVPRELICVAYRGLVKHFPSRTIA